MVAIQKFYAKYEKQKVKITVDGAGIYVTEDTKQQKKLLAHPTREITEWVVPHSHPNTLRIKVKQASSSKTMTTIEFDCKNAKESLSLATSIQGAVMAVAAWTIDKKTAVES